MIRVDKLEVDEMKVDEMEVDEMSLVLRKPLFGVSDQVPHKPGFTTTQDGQRLEISYIGSREIVLSM